MAANNTNDTFSGLMENVPKDFVDLAEALSTPDNTIINVMGVVSDFQPAAPTRGADWQMTIRLKDHKCEGNSSFRVKYFTKQERMPHGVSVGDVALLRKVKVSSYGGVKGCLTSWDSCTVIFPAGLIPVPEFRVEYAAGISKLQGHSVGRSPHEPTIQEQFYAIALRHWSINDFLRTPIHNMTSDRPVSRIKTSGMTNSHNPTAVTHGGDKFRLISDITANQFCNLIAEIVKIYADGQNSLEIYVSDYTSNSLLYDKPIPDDLEEQNPDGDMYNYIPRPRKSWEGPYGKMTLQIKAWDPHSYWIRDNVNEGDIVLIRNVHIKYITTGYSQILAGSLHQDRLRPNQVDVQKVDPTELRVRQLVGRKSQYVGDMRKRFGGGHGSKKKRKKKAAEARKAAMLNASNTNPSRPPSVNDAMDIDDVAHLPEGQVLTPHQSNAYVSCTHDDIPLTTLKDMCDMDRSFKDQNIQHRWNYTNQKVHARIRVLDYFPEELEQFSHSLDDSNFQTAGEVQPGRWEWLFYLRIEDASAPSGSGEPITISVSGPDASALLKMTPCNLRDDPRKLSMLKDKLFILWGNAEELKSSGVMLPNPRHSSKPFDCCIQEYGTLLPGDTDWSHARRNFGLFGTSILM